MAYMWMLLTFGSLLLMVYGDFIAEKKAKKTQGRWCLAIGGTVAAIVAFIQAVQQEGYQTRIDTLTNETRAFVSGGDSYVVLQPFRLNQEEFLRVIAEHHGVDPVPAFDVRINLDVSAKCDQTLNATFRPGDPRRSYFAAITPQMPQWTEIRLTATCPQTLYEAYTDTRNRLTYQQILVTKDGNQLPWRLRVIDVLTLRVLHFEPADSEFFQWPDVPERIKKISAEINRKAKRATERD